MIASVFNSGGSAPLVLICEHASNVVPPEYEKLGLTDAELTRHIAWDPGALPVAQALARQLDAPLVFANVSRLVIDLNRAPTDFDSIPEISETTQIPGNLHLSPEERQARVDAYYHPFHQAVDDVIATRKSLQAIISIHSFTPVYKGVSRPWHAGIITGPDEKFSRAIVTGLRKDPAIVADINVPYSPTDRVYHTLERHSRSNGAMTAMIELRNDLISDASGQQSWSERLAQSIRAALHTSAYTKGHEM